MSSQNTRASFSTHWAIIGLALWITAGCSTPGTTELPQIMHPSAAKYNRIAIPNHETTPHSVDLIPSASSNIDALIQQEFLIAKKLVEQETKTQLDHVDLKIVSGIAIHKEVKRESRQLVQSQFTNKEYAEKFLNQMVGDQSNSYAALYTDQGSRVLVNRDLMRTYLNISQQSNTSTEEALLVLLIHELVHAADDTNFQIHKNRVMNFKVSFTQSAAFEGHAQLVTRSICKQHNCLRGMQALDDFMFAPVKTNDPVLQSVQAISRNVLEYSYVEGERFLTELMRRPNGQQLIENVLRTPPEDPIQILSPATYPNRDREQRNQRLRDAVHNSGHLWTRHPFRIIQTSPIKGINIRNHPERRSAAIEGFTQLITAMESAQIYNQSLDSLTPIEVTLIEAENDDTARMFAESFMQHAVDNTGQQQPSSHQLATADSSAPDGHHTGIALLFTSEADTGESPGHNVMVALMGQYVLQLTGSDEQPMAWKDFAESVFSHIGVNPNGS